MTNLVKLRVELIGKKLQVSIRVGPPGEPGRQVGILNCTPSEWYTIRSFFTINKLALGCLESSLPFVQDYVGLHMLEHGECKECGFTSDLEYEEEEHDMACTVGDAANLRDTIKKAILQFKKEVEIQDEWQGGKRHGTVT